jgi:hypothetical protein
LQRILPVVRDRSSLHGLCRCPVFLSQRSFVWKAGQFQTTNGCNFMDGSG